jgi:hypothetical protein
MLSGDHHRICADLEMAAAVTPADGLNEIQSTARLAATTPGIQESTLAAGRDLHRYDVPDLGRRTSRGEVLGASERNRTCQHRLEPLS